MIFVPTALGLNPTAIEDLLDYTSMLRKIFEAGTLPKKDQLRFRHEAPIRRDVLPAPKNMLHKRYADALGKTRESVRAQLNSPKAKADSAEYEAFQKFVTREDELALSLLSRAPDRRCYKLTRPHMRALFADVALWIDRVIISEEDLETLAHTLHDAFDKVNEPMLRKAGYRGNFLGKPFLTSAEESPFKIPKGEMYLIGRDLGVFHAEEEVKIDYQESNGHPTVSFTHTYGAKLRRRSKLMAVTTSA